MKHACGQCNETFSSEAAYLKHHCSKQTPPPAPKLSESDILAAVTSLRRHKKGHV